MVDGIVESIAVAVWLMLPAYLPNNVAVIAGGGPPIDGGRTWRGRRLLGDGKTWRGTVAGIFAGATVAGGLSLIASRATAILGFTAPGFPVLVAVALPAGALGGDVAASFLKRRLGRARGTPTPGLDQLDLVVGALVSVTVLAPEWAGKWVWERPGVLVAILLLTPALHVSTNAIAYRLGLKDEPW